MLCQTGVRCSELLDLRLGDLDFSQRRLFINSGKNGDERVAYLTPALMASLARYLACRPVNDNDHLWLLADGSPLQGRQVGYRLKKWGMLALWRYRPIVCAILLPRSWLIRECPCLQWQSCWDIANWI